jgi:hypothetical protein
MVLSMVTPQGSTSINTIVSIGECIYDKVAVSVYLGVKVVYLASEIIILDMAKLCGPVAR